MTDELTKLMNKAVDCSDERGYYRDTDKALKQIFEFYIEHRPHIAELTARRDIFRDIDLPALAEAQFTVRQLPDMLKRIAQLEARLEQRKTPDQRTLPTLPQPTTPKPPETKSEAPDSNPPAETLQARARAVMGDRYQPPAVKLFDYGD